MTTILEGAELLLEVEHPFPAYLGGERAGLEGAQVAVDGGLRGPDLPVDAGELPVVLGFLVLRPLVEARDGASEKRAVLEAGDEMREDVAFEVARWESLLVADLGAELRARGARVVAVVAAVAVGGDADKPLIRGKTADFRVKRFVGRARAAGGPENQGGVGTGPGRNRREASHV